MISTAGMPEPRLVRRIIRATMAAAHYSRLTVGPGASGRSCPVKSETRGQRNFSSASSAKAWKRMYVDDPGDVPNWLGPVYDAGKHHRSDHERDGTIQFKSGAV